MAYDKAKLEKQALKAIQEHKLFFINDLTAYLPCATSTFYSLKLEQSESIKTALEQNRVKTKHNLRNKWYKSDNATMTLALYKLLGNDDERRKLAQQYTEHSGGVEVKGATIEFSENPTENTGTDIS